MKKPASSSQPLEKTINKLIHKLKRENQPPSDKISPLDALKLAKTAAHQQTQRVMLLLQEINKWCTDTLSIILLIPSLFYPHLTPKYPLFSFKRQ